MGLRPNVEGRIAIINLTDGHHPLMQALSKPNLHIECRPEIAEAALERTFAFFDKHLNA